jgi:hypothetical protein
MATIPPTTTTRNANLTKLKTEALTWFTKETNRLDNESKFLQAVLSGRRGIQKTANTNLESVGNIVVSEINAFINSD